MADGALEETEGSTRRRCGLCDPPGRAKTVTGTVGREDAGEGWTAQRVGSRTSQAEVFEVCAGAEARASGVARTLAEC